MNNFNQFPIIEKGISFTFQIEMKNQGVSVNFGPILGQNGKISFFLPKKLPYF